MAGVVNIPWYATVFRADKLEAAIELIAPLALRYGATDYRVYRNRDDRYKFMQMATFEDKLDFERYWYGAEFSRLAPRLLELVPGARRLLLERHGLPGQPRARRRTAEAI